MSEQPEVTTITPEDASNMDALKNALAPIPNEPQPEPPEDAPEDETPEEVPEEDEPETKPEPEDGGDEVTILDYLGLSEEQVEEVDGKLYVKAKIDGSVEPVELPQLLEGYQKNKSSDERFRQAKALSEEAKAQTEALQTQYNQKLQETKLIVDKMAEAQLAQYQNVNWEQLRATNPGEYAAAVADYNLKQQQVQGLQQQVSNELNIAIEQQQQEAAKQMEQHQQEQAAKILEANPEWKDPVKFQEASTKMAQHLTAQGFTPDEINEIRDARVVGLIQKAMAYDELKSNTAEKKVKADTPKYKKPLAARRAQTENARIKKSQLEAYKKSGSDKDGAVLLKDIMFGE